MPIYGLTPPGKVPCGPCHACCHSELVALLADEGDDVASYEHELIFLDGLGEQPYLKHRKDGACVYLGRDGCTIHHRRPYMCRIFDCRVHYLNYSREQRREFCEGSPLARKIFNAGKQRLPTLDLSKGQS
jgi:uncharacterized protein